MADQTPAAGGRPNGERRAHDVRDRIFASAMRHFSARGFASSSLREIAEDARTTKPMIFYYFGSKERLYGSVMRESIEDAVVAIREDLAADAPVAVRVLAFCERYLDHFLAHQASIALLVREVFGLGGMPMADATFAMRERIREPLCAVLREGMETGVLQQDEVATCASAIVGILNMFILAHVFAGQPIDRADVLRQVGYYAAGLSAPPD
jgi:AcrR family transcriptional regulator